MKNIYGKHVFITGASSGIGCACAEAFAKNGCAVTGVSRRCKAGKITYPGGGSVTLRPLDITDEAAVTAFVEELPRIDIAVLAAGMGVAGPAETLPEEMLRQQMEVNYFGTVRTAQCVLTKMRRQGKGLLLLIGSIAGRVSIPMQSQYSASKYALEAFSDAVRMEMRPFGVRISILEPGDTKTGFTGARRTMDDAGPYGAVLGKSVAKMAKDEQKGRDPMSVAKVAMKLAGKKNPPARVPIGAEYKALMFLLRILPDRVKEKILSEMYLPS